MGRHSIQGMGPCYSTASQFGFSNGLSKVIFRILPGALHLVLHTGKARNPVTDQLVDQKQRTTNGRCTDNQRRNRQVVGHRQGDQQLGVDAIGNQIQVPLSSRLVEGPVMVMGSRVTNTPLLAANKPLTRS